MRNGTKIPKRPRGRPRGFDPDEVLDRVRAVFMEKGYAATSLDDIAASSGLNRPSLYAAFGDKEDLYILALKRYGAFSLAGLETVLAQPKPIAQRLADAYAGAIRFYCAPPKPPGCMIVGTAATEALSHPRIARAAAGLLADIEASLERAFEMAVRAGELPHRPLPATRARMAGSIFDTLAIRARLGTPAAELKALALSMIPAICG